MIFFWSLCTHAYTHTHSTRTCTHAHTDISVHDTCANIVHVCKHSKILFSLTFFLARNLFKRKLTLKLQKKKQKKKMVMMMKKKKMKKMKKMMMMMMMMMKKKKKKKQQQKHKHMQTSRLVCTTTPVAIKTSTKNYHRKTKHCLLRVQ